MQCVLIRSVTYADVMTACVYYHYLEDSQYQYLTKHPRLAVSAA